MTESTTGSNLGLIHISNYFTCLDMGLGCYNYAFDERLLSFHDIFKIVIIYTVLRCWWCRTLSIVRFFKVITKIVLRFFLIWLFLLCSKTDCRLLASHDDYSIMSKLPRDRTSVVTILRNPIDRIFSTYEFSIEVAARFLIHPNLTSATRMSGRLRSKTKGISTLDIWPWKYLVPWMREDLFARVCLFKSYHLIVPT